MLNFDYKIFCFCKIKTVFCVFIKFWKLIITNRLLVIQNCLLTINPDFMYFLESE